jgi:ADP-ribosylglycohydrolase
MFCFSVIQRGEKLKFTDDTAMARSVAQSIIERREVDVLAMAKKQVLLVV